jgi:arginyl-tRNA synthetase
MAHESIRSALGVVLTEMGVDDAEIQLERPRDPSHGDVASNVAMTLARALRRSPRQIAEEIAERIDRAAAGVDAVEVAGPGFLNFTLAAGAVGSAVDRGGGPIRGRVDR